MNTATAPTINVSELPPHVMDHRSPIWWGNALLLCIETTMFGLLVATYFYLRMNFPHWPPPRPEFHLFETKPDLGFSTANLVLILVSSIPMLLVDRACMQRNVPFVKIGMLIMVILGLGTIVLRFLEFSGLKLRWDDNAYAAIVWTTVGMHLLHLVTGTAENFIMTLWVWLKGMDDQHARDIRVGAAYWYWIVGVWVPLYLIIYFGPRFT